MRCAAGARTAAACCLASTRDAADAGRQPLFPTLDGRARARRDRARSPEPALPEPLPMPRAFTGTYSPDGRRVAYEDFSVAFFRRVGAGAEQPVAALPRRAHAPDPRDQPRRPLGGEASVDQQQRHHADVGRQHGLLPLRPQLTTNLFCYEPRTKQVAQLTRHDDFDIMSASAGPDAIVYEQAGYIHLVDTATRKSQRLAIEVAGRLPVGAPAVQESGRHDSQRRAVAHRRSRGLRSAGRHLHRPGRKGQARNLTQSSGAHDRSPVWSPDGAQIAWLSDASGEYQLMIGEQTGATKPRAIALPSKAFFSAPVWSPDGKQLLLEDNHLNLWAIDIATGTATKLDTDTYDDPGRRFDAVWSPDSRWVAYSKSLNSHLRAIFLYSIADRKAHQITDGLSDAIAPAFDAGGKYLYFLASTNYALRTGWLEMSSVDRPVTRAIYLAVLSASEPSPFLPETGDETVAPPANPRGRQPAAKPPADAKAQSPATVRIDVAGIGQRILALARSGRRLQRARAGPRRDALLRGNAASGRAPRADRPSLSAQRAQSGAVPRGRPLVHALRRHEEAAVSRRRQPLGHRPHRSARESRRGRHRCRTRSKRGSIRAPEWAQIFRETWRIQREFFYDATMHGADWQAVYEKYSPLLPHVAHRADLGYLIATVGGELGVGHSYLLGGGDLPGGDPVSVGLLGADYAIENGRYRIKKIYGGENWNPELQAPLSAPGIQVSEGDYLLEVNGRPLTPPTSVYQLFEGTAGKQTLMRVNSSPSLEGSRVVTVVPVASEEALRTRAWIEGNRRLVDKLSGGRLAYVWLPNTGGPGYTAFNRYYYAQQDKEGAIIDERYNQGGMVADYIVNELTQAADGLLRAARRQAVDVADGRHLRTQGDDHQRVGRVGRRCAALLLQAAKGRPARRHAHLGRAGRHAPDSRHHRWRRHHGAVAGVLRPQRPVGGGERRRRA